MSPGKNKLLRLYVLKLEWMEAAFTVLIFVYTGRKKTWINFLTVRKLELDFTNLFNHGENNQHWIVYWSLGKKKVLMNVNSEIRFLYSDLSSNLSSCTSVSYKPRLILLPSQGFTHTNRFRFFLFLTATITAAVYLSLQFSFFKSFFIIF